VIKKIVLFLIIIMMVFVSIGRGKVTIFMDKLNDGSIIFDEKNGGDKYTGFRNDTYEPDLWVFSHKNKVSTLVTAKGNEYGNGWSDHLSISTSGKKSVFHSWSTNFIETFVSANVFMKDIDSDDIVLIKDHALSPEITPNERYIVYEYNANPDTCFPAIYRYDETTDEEIFIDYTCVGNDKGGWHFPNPSISSNGKVVTYHTTKNGYPEVWQWNDGSLSKVRDGTI